VRRDWIWGSQFAAKKSPAGQTGGAQIRAVCEALSGRNTGCGGRLFSRTRGDVEIALIERRLIFVR
jgi:hypothetical protein